MRSLSSALNTAYGYAVQQPAWLIEIHFSTVVRYCSALQTTWNSQTWVQRDIDVSSLNVEALKISGNIVAGNADDGFGATVLSEGVTDRQIKIWGFDQGIGTTLAFDDAVPLCDAVGAGANVAEEKVTIGLRDPVEFRMGPRAIVTPQYGFNVLLAAGRTLTINGLSFTINRGR